MENDSAENAQSLDCWTCGPIDEFSNLAGDFTDDLSSLLQGPMIMIFGSLVGLWIVICGYKLLMGKLTPDGFVTEFFIIVFASVLLGTTGTDIVSDIYKVSIDLLGGVGKTALSVGLPEEVNKNSLSGLPALVQQTEFAIQIVFSLAKTISDKGSITNPDNYLFAIFLILPYFIIIVMYFSKVLVTIFRVMILAAFSSQLIMCFAFGWGRPMAIGGIKTLVSTIMVFFATTVAVSIAVYGINFLALEELEANQIEDLASFDNAKFILILLLGWAGPAFMAEATSIANSISGTMLSNASTGILTAASTGMAATTVKTSNMFNPMADKNVASMASGAAANASNAFQATGAGINAAQATGRSVAGAAGNIANKFTNHQTMNPEKINSRLGS